MEDIEIYQLASQVLSDITRDLNGGIYARLGGELSIKWGCPKICVNQSLPGSQSKVCSGRGLVIYNRFDFQATYCSR